MAPSFFSTLASAGALLAAATPAMAGFNPASGTNVAVYWGQNSYNQGSGSLAQQRLGYYCDSKSCVESGGKKRRETNEWRR